jgi:hypothetical protein
LKTALSGPFSLIETALIADIHGLGMGLSLANRHWVQTPGCGASCCHPSLLLLAIHLSIDFFMFHFAPIFSCFHSFSVTSCTNGCLHPAFPLV